jgi:hypothetical protein
MDEPHGSNQLYTFHRVLIGTAIALCVVMVPWGIMAYRDSGDAGSLGVAGVAAVMGVGLSLYLRRFLRRTRR